MARVNPPSILAAALCGYADQLDEIRSSLSAMAQQSGEYKDIVARMATNVHSASDVLRATSRVLDSTATHKENDAKGTERAAAMARRVGR